MATLEISLRDWLNDQPVPGAPLEAIAVVVASYTVPMLNSPPQRRPSSGANTSEADAKIARIRNRRPGCPFPAPSVSLGFQHPRLERCRATRNGGFRAIRA